MVMKEWNKPLLTPVAIDVNTEFAVMYRRISFCIIGWILTDLIKLNQERWELVTWMCIHKMEMRFVDIVPPVPAHLPITLLKIID